MPRTVEDMKGLWQGWKDLFEMINDQGTLWDHIGVLLLMPIYPLVWCLVYTYLKFLK